MSYAQPSDASLESVIDYVVGVIAVLQATPELAALAPPWHKLRDNLLKARDDRDQKRWKLLGAQRKVGVLDVKWDAAVGDLSGRAFLAAGKDAKAHPYADLFSPLVADDLKRLGPVRAAAAEEVIQAKGKALAHPDLTKSLDGLDKATVALTAADTERTAALQVVLVLDIERTKQIAAVDLLVATTEIGVLTAFPGQREIVRAVLAPAKAEKKAKADTAATVTPAT